LQVFSESFENQGIFDSLPCRGKVNSIATISQVYKRFSALFLNLACAALN
jgi:hypothetical protein